MIININIREEKRCKIIIKYGIFNDIASLLDKRSFVVIITNKIIEGLYGQRLKTQLENHHFCVKLFTLPDTEEAKNIKYITDIYNGLSYLGLSKEATVVALGGGVVGDVAGFIAATYLRGLRFVQVPTTLLAQVDSSIGGKAAINTPYAKNIIGVFYQPELVIIDPALLETLPIEVFREGISEIIKYGIIKGKELFRYLEENIDGLLKRDKKILQKIISSCCKIKAAIVEEDEREVKRKRWILNLGHTFAHGIEAAYGYRKSHAEAVLLGIMLAARLSHNLGLLSHKNFIRIKNLISAAGVPHDIKELSAKKEKIYHSMSFDKKRSQTALRFILIKDIGRVVIKEGITQEEIYQLFVDSEGENNSS